MPLPATTMHPDQHHLDDDHGVRGDLASRARDYARIEAALEWLAAHRSQQPDLEQAAQAAGMSAFHFQRVFTRWAGVTPKQFLQHLAVREAKRRLEAGASVLDAALDAGFSGPGRLHDALLRVEAVTPGEYRSGLEGVEVRYGFHPSPFGEMLLMASPRGLCGLGFVGRDGRDAALADRCRRMPGASLIRDQAHTAGTARRVFAPDPGKGATLRLYLNGTRFQVQVWRALLALPPGTLCTYQAVAARSGNPRAVRAAASAVADNPIAYLIPCHRVIRKSGVIGDYHWGAARKLALIGSEQVARGEAHVR